MYIRDCGYGRSKRCKKKIWPMMGALIAALGMGGVTIHVMAGQAQNTQGKLILAESNIVMNTVEDTNTPVADDRKVTEAVIVEEDKTLIAIDPGHGGEDTGCICGGVDQSKVVEGIASGIDLYFKPKTMYLTFDDGPVPENTEQILDILKEKNIKATFFVIGENVRKNPEIAKRIVEEGHTIGIHCNWHDYAVLYADVESYVADFEKAYRTVYEVTGVKADIFRFPGGSINSYNKQVYKDIIEEMTSRGYIYFDWNASLEDAVTKSSPEQLIQNAKESTLGRKRVVMLAHDTVDNTVLCLEELIEQLPEYKMEQLTHEVVPIQF